MFVNKKGTALTGGPGSIDFTSSGLKNKATIGCAGVWHRRGGKHNKGDLFGLFNCFGRYRRDV